MKTKQNESSAVYPDAKEIFMGLIKLGVSLENMRIREHSVSINEYCQVVFTHVESTNFHATLKISDSNKRCLYIGSNYKLLRFRLTNNPASPSPKSASEAGSGTSMV